MKQSMVARAGDDRYRLLDTLRAYALDVLADLDADDTRDRHADFYVDLAEHGEVGDPRRRTSSAGSTGSAATSTTSAPRSSGACSPATSTARHAWPARWPGSGRSTAC